MTMEFNLKNKVQTMALRTLVHGVCFEMADTQPGINFMVVRSNPRGDEAGSVNNPEGGVQCVNLNTGILTFIHSESQVRVMVLEVTGKRYL